MKIADKIEMMLTAICNEIVNKYNIGKPDIFIDYETLYDEDCATPTAYIYIYENGQTDDYLKIEVLHNYICISAYIYMNNGAYNYAGILGYNLQSVNELKHMSRYAL